MRRLAKQERNDGYSSKKDYQDIIDTVSLRISPKSTTNKLFFLKKNRSPDAATDFYGFGGFIRSEKPITLVISIKSEQYHCSKEIEVSSRWTRFGIASDLNLSNYKNLSISLEWSSNCFVDLWGISFGEIYLPQMIVDQKPLVEELNKTHVVPEMFYFSHGDLSIDDIDLERSSPFYEKTGSKIHLKKCSYCQRQLPLNPSALGSLSFHKHNAKISKHQNECRSCKKWRINNTFNPLRTTDQLHESSVITRERKLLLKEPEILQTIKDKSGAGLKSQIWEKFERKCFFCKKTVELKDFQLDHTRPLAYLWAIDEYATCLCSEHNNLKKDKFPVDFYTEDQLLELSKITGLEYEKLIIRDVNQEQLDRILEDISHFAKSWDARTFAAIARKIIEVRPKVDLFKILEGKDRSEHQRLVLELKNRPDPLLE
tara:strand:- start:172 stop:1455 length:1284 start_codon:yes stop_codon:yes gene_type:complete